MPSVFNHENACWGVKRSFCNVLQFDFEELQTRKLTELGIVPNSKTEAPINNSVQFSVSSNGYYGFQPHSIIHDRVTDDNAMDVEDNFNVTPTSSSGKNDVHASNVLEANRNFQNCKRKIPTEFIENSKRMRHEEVAVADPIVLPSHHKEYNSHPKCLMGHYM